MLDLYTKVCFLFSKKITFEYSTSFSLGIRLLSSEHQKAIYSIYGFVRLADEIVDTFLDYNPKDLLDEFRVDVELALERKISTNPILHAFKSTFYTFKLEKSWVDSFLESMQMDLKSIIYTQDLYEKYIYGSAEVIGLMCTRVLCFPDIKKSQEIEFYSKSLGAAFQKVNFLRDFGADFYERNRIYFPKICYETFSIEEKKRIEKDIHQDFERAYIGVLKLPKKGRWGVLLIYHYYHFLFEKLQKSSVAELKQKRIGVSTLQKFWIALKVIIFRR